MNSLDTGRRLFTARIVRKAGQVALLALASAILLGGSCDTLIEYDVEPAWGVFTLVPDSGTGQTAVTGASVRVVARLGDTEAKLGAEGVDIHWAVGVGGGSVVAAGQTNPNLAARGRTDVSGRSAAAWTLGSQAGPQTLTATAMTYSRDNADYGPSKDPRHTATFTATAVANTCPATGVCTVTISTNGNATSVRIGHTLLFQAILRDAAGAQITTGATVSYSSSNNAIARVDAAPPGGPPGYFANIAGVSAGQATITANANGRTGSAVITVTP